MTEAMLLNTVRAHGMRVSTARRSVLARLLGASEPLTAEEVAGGADLASVYRNLGALEAIGVVEHIHIGHGPSRFALSGRARGWTTCEACGRSTPLTEDELNRIRTSVLAIARFDARFDHFSIVGRCTDCI